MYHLLLIRPLVPAAVLDCSFENGTMFFKKVVCIRVTNNWGALGKSVELGAYLIFCLNNTKKGLETLRNCPNPKLQSLPKGLGAPSNLCIISNNNYIFIHITRVKSPPKTMLN